MPGRSVATPHLRTGDANGLGTVARNYPREDVRYIEVADADPAVVSIAWTRQAARPIIGAFIEITRSVVRSRAEHPNERS